MSLPCPKTFADFWNSPIEGTSSLADIRLTGFLVQHCFPCELLTLVSIGEPSITEFLAFNALVLRPASYIVLGELAVGQDRRTQLHGLPEIATHEGYENRALIADLTLPGRWSQLLQAISTSQVGVLGISASWARSEPRFWENVALFAKSNNSVVFIRGLFDYHDPTTSFALLNSIPADGGLALLASTPTSIWWAAPAQVTVLREKLINSGLFDGIAASEQAGPLIVENQWFPGIVDPVGRFACKQFVSLADPVEGLEFRSGWATPERDGRWSVGDEATAVVSWTDDTPPPKHISLSGNGWVPPDNPWQRVEIGLGSSPNALTELHFSNGTEIKDAILSVSSRDIVRNRLTLHFKIRNPGRPSDHGASDTRVLGFKFRSLRLFA